MSDENGLVLGYQVLADHWPMQAGQCAKENGEFVPTGAWSSIQHERQENALQVHQLAGNPSWALTMGLLGVGILAGYLWGLLDRWMLSRKRKSL